MPDVPAASLTSVARQFNLGVVEGAELFAAGGGDTFKLHTASGVFVAKGGLTLRQARLAAQVATTLNQAGVRQPRMHRTASGSLLSDEGYALFDYLEGSWTNHPSPNQAAALARYLAAYNRALESVPAPAWVQTQHSLWQQANSLSYLRDHLPGLMARLPASRFYAETAATALNLLGKEEGRLRDGPQQLVHGDVGGSNILYSGSEVVTLLDFTPYYDSHWYPLCVAFYWHYGYYTPGSLDLARIRQDLLLYLEHYPPAPLTKKLFPLVFLKAALRIAVVPLLLDLEGLHPFLPEDERRAAVLRQIVEHSERFL